MKKKTAMSLVNAVKTSRVKENDNLTVICEYFGIEPEKDRLAYEIFMEIIEANKKNRGVKTIDVTKKTHVTQAAVVYHMNTFMKNGLIIREGTAYRLRGRNLDETFDELEQDMLRRMRRMRELAKRLDKRFFEI